MKKITFAIGEKVQFVYENEMVSGTITRLIDIEPPVFIIETDKGEYKKVGIEKVVKINEAANSDMKEQEQVNDIPEEYKDNPVYIEMKTQRAGLVMQPSLYKKAKSQAKKENISFNELVHKALINYLNEEPEAEKEDFVKPEYIEKRTIQLTQREFKEKAFDIMHDIGDETDRLMAAFIFTPFIGKLARALFIEEVKDDESGD